MLYAVASVLALVAHELGHLSCALALNVKVRRAGMSWRGPYIVRERGTDIENLAISLSGPLVNLLLAALVPMYVWATGAGGVMFAFTNLALGVFNLLPIPSSDGARILSLLVARPRKPAQAA